MKQTIIIEHLEPKIWPWCKIEYKNMSKLIQKRNLWFTNIHEKANLLKKLGKVSKQSVINLNLKNVCVLDPDAPKTLNLKESKSFKYFIIGGILGDYPPKKRTKVELTNKLKQAEVRNLGKKQFSTDNAVYVLKEIINGKELKDIKFKNKIIIKINNIESVDLPYYYPIVNGKPRISEELVSYIKNKEDF
ncbi:MAG: SAM-dependent methyltransferase [Nanoarchaeota archaeon]